MASKNTKRTPASFRQVRNTCTAQDRQKIVYHVHQQTTDTGNRKQIGFTRARQHPNRQPTKLKSTNVNRVAKRAPSDNGWLILTDRSSHGHQRHLCFLICRTRSTSNTSRAEATNVDVRPKNCALSQTVQPSSWKCPTQVNSNRYASCLRDECRLRTEARAIGKQGSPATLQQKYTRIQTGTCHNGVLLPSNMDTRRSCDNLLTHTHTLPAPLSLRRQLSESTNTQLETLNTT